jgi:hypothetical protein
MHADVEWRHVCALAMVWEIYASEEHLKFLHMVLEDEGKRYVSAAEEPLKTSIRELSGSHEEDIKERIDSGVTAYSHNVMLFAVGDTQLDCLKNTHTSFHVSAGINITTNDQLKVIDMDSDSDDSGVALTNSEEDRLHEAVRRTSKLGSPAGDR